MLSYLWKFNCVHRPRLDHTYVSCSRACLDGSLCCTTRSHTDLSDFLSTSRLGCQTAGVTVGFPVRATHWVILHGADSHTWPLGAQFLHWYTDFLIFLIESVVSVLSISFIPFVGVYWVALQSLYVASFHQSDPSWASAHTNTLELLSNGASLVTRKSPVTPPGHIPGAAAWLIFYFGTCAATATYPRDDGSPTSQFLHRSTLLQVAWSTRQGFHTTVDDVDQHHQWRHTQHFDIHIGLLFGVWISNNVQNHSFMIEW